MTKREFDLDEGERLNRSPQKPIITVIGRGKETYLWIGNNSEDDRSCFATLSGDAVMELAREILKREG